MCTGQSRHIKQQQISLRSKRFRRVFRPFEAFFAFWRRKSWGECNTWWKQQGGGGDVCLCDSCARKIRNLGALFEVIRSAIGSESAVSQTPTEQSIKTVLSEFAKQQTRYLPLPLLVLFCARPNFRAFKKRKLKVLETCGKPYGNVCYAG